MEGLQNLSSIHKEQVIGRGGLLLSTGLSQMTNKNRPAQIAAGLGIMGMDWIGTAGAALGCAAHAAVFH